MFGYVNEKISVAINKLPLQDGTKVITTQFVIEFWAPLLISVFLTVIGKYRSAGSYDLLEKGILNFFAAGWFFTQINRIQKQKKTESGLETVKGDLKCLLGDLNETTAKLSGYATGGDSFCFLRRDLPGALLPHLFVLSTSGEFPLRNVKVGIVNINRLNLHPTVETYSENDQFYPHLRPGGEENIELVTGNEDFFGKDGNVIRVYVESLSGSFEQYLRMLLIDGKIEWASVVLRGDTIVHEDHSQKFPLLDEGKIDWGPVHDPTKGKQKTIK
jgi:hypothetical protein